MSQVYISAGGSEILTENVKVTPKYRGIVPQIWARPFPSNTFQSLTYHPTVRH